MARLEAYLREALIPYFEVDDDTHLDKAMRCVEGAIYLAK